MSERKPPPNGEIASKRSGTRSANSFQGVDPKLTMVLKAVYNAYQKLDDRDDNARCRWNFVFHMTDWVKDLRQLADLYEHPERYKKDAAEEIVFGFLVHAVPHLQAAARNLGAASRDIFHEPDRETLGRF
jgi:hypothetical protein